MQSNNIIRICAAGSGKTWGICNEALTVASNTANNKRVLITTYTNKGVEAIYSELVKQNMGVPSKKVMVRSWYQFLLWELIKPYQTMIVGINEIRSLDFSDRFGKPNYGRAGTKRRYFSGFDVKKDYASELAVYINEQSKGAVIRRLEEIYSHLYIDEMQDMAGYDLEIIKLLFKSSITTICVGDNKQATYSTHNTRTNKRLTGKNLWHFCNQVEQQRMAVIEKCLISRRFNQNICSFANTVFPDFNNISTSMTEVTGHDGAFLISKNDVEVYCDFFSPAVLRFDKRTKTDGYSLNFGQCKGMTFNRVLIFPNGPLTDFLQGKPLQSPEKYYVAVTRPRYSLAIVVDKMPNNPLFEDVEIDLGEKTIRAKRFIEHNSC
jgi:DNA helicase-2/ATP-dependent DNA helicase PcrA